MIRVDCPPLHVGDEDWFYGTAYNSDHAGHNYYNTGRRSLIQGALYVENAPIGSVLNGHMGAYGPIRGGSGTAQDIV